MKINELFESNVDEGAMDYARGVGRHFGQKIKDNLEDTGRRILQPFQDAHAAGKQASATGNAKAFKAELFGTIGQLTTIIQKLSELDRPVRANEGMWDYMRGAGGAVGQQARSAGKAVGQRAREVGSAISQQARSAGQAVNRNIQSIHQQGQEASRVGDINKLKAQRDATIRRLIQLSTKISSSKAKNEIIAAIRLYGKNKGLSLSVIQKAVTAFDTAITASNNARSPERVEPTL